MKRPSRRSLLALAALLLLPCLLQRPAPALDLLKNVSKEEAKQLGIVVTAKPRDSGDVWVQVEYKAAGPMKEFKYTHLRLAKDGKRLVSASLQPVKPTPDTMRFDFYVDPAMLPHATVTIVVWSDPLTGTGYVLKMKDYLPPGK